MTWLPRKLMLAVVTALSLTAFAAAADNQPPQGYIALFNGTDLMGWKGLVGNPKTRAEMKPEELAEKQKVADESMRAHWSVRDGVLTFDGKGENICTDKDYGDFDLQVDWKILPKGDSGIYLRGTPQVQIWDPKAEPRNAVGSGGLFNNKKPLRSTTVSNKSRINLANSPSERADKPVGEWNRFNIVMIGKKVAVILNGIPVVDNVELENYWEPEKPIYPTGQIELQNHGNQLFFKNIYIKEIQTEQ